ncbi:MAG: hypothetical protein MZV63_20505 [Marinilabiliales bacterium]|nr:hypothetical protein [Marinilabiliales bacterium]
MIYYSDGGPERDLKKEEIRAALKTALGSFTDREEGAYPSPGHNPCTLGCRHDNRTALAATR